MRELYIRNLEMIMDGFIKLGLMLAMYSHQGLCYSPLRHIFRKIKGVMLNLKKVDYCSILQGLMKGTDWYKDTGNDKIYV